MEVIALFDFHSKVTDGYIPSPISGCVSLLFIYLGFYIAFNTVQVISRWVVGRAVHKVRQGSVL